MRCPTCREPLIVVERDSIELDHCPWCRGLWCDAGELELLAERFAGGWRPDLAELPAATPPEKPRRCPRCDVRMVALRAGTAPEVVIDRCPAGHGAWLERGELGALISQRAEAVAPGSAEVVAFLGETFRALLSGRVPALRGEK